MYRNLNILNKQGVRLNKPTAQFSANRIVNGEVADMAISYAGYDYNTEFPTLVCYVGDTLTFTDIISKNINKCNTLHSLFLCLATCGKLIRELRTPYMSYIVERKKGTMPRC